MKRVLLLCLVLLLAVVSSAYSMEPTVVVVMHQPKLLYNNHVGNEWGYEASYGDLKLRVMEPAYVGSVDNTVTIQVVAWEYDTYSDVGFGRISLRTDELSSHESKMYECRVVVVEDRGRYAGCAAEWLFSFEARLKRSDETIPEQK